MKREKKRVMHAIKGGSTDQSHQAIGQKTIITANWYITKYLTEILLEDSCFTIIYLLIQQH